MNSTIRIILFVLCLLAAMTGCQSQQTSQSSQSSSQSSTESSSQNSSESSQANSTQNSNEKSNENAAQSPSSASSAASQSTAFPEATDTESASGAQKTAPPPPSGDGYPSSASATQDGEEIYPPAGANAAGVTTEEAIGELDEQLNASLGVFDGMILTERAAAQSQQADTNQGGSAGANSDDDELAGTAGDGGFGGPLFEEGDLSEAGGQPGGEQAGEDGEEATVAAMPGSVKSDATLAGRQTSGGDGTVPPDLVDGSDDDIVARQIREAAMKETDPALKEKLWQEYRNYKKGQ